MKAVLKIALFLSFLIQSCADSGFLDRTRKDQSILDGSQVPVNHPFSESIVLIAQDLVFKNDQPLFFGLCSGVIISNRIILTAAHCLDHGYKKMKVLLTPNPREDLLQKDIFNVVEAEIHPTYFLKKIQSSELTSVDSSYESTLTYSDIAMILVDRDFPASSISSTSLTLAKVQSSAPEKAFIAGFGKTTRQKDTQNLNYKEVNGVLKQAELNLTPENFQGDRVALSQEQGSGVCRGDSGAPLFIKENGIYKLMSIAIGVYSFNRVFNSTETQADECSGYGIYQNIEPLRSWILLAKQILRTKSSSKSTSSKVKTF